jgi:hypothetical protein
MINLVGQQLTKNINSRWKSIVCVLWIKRQHSRFLQL